jgi:hypothetical protein
VRNQFMYSGTLHACIAFADINKIKTAIERNKISSQVNNTQALGTPHYMHIH